MAVAVEGGEVSTQATVHDVPDTVGATVSVGEVSTYAADRDSPMAVSELEGGTAICDLPVAGVNSSLRQLFMTVQWQ